MLQTLRLAALLAALAVPALAQSTSTTTPRPAPPAAAVRPTAPVVPPPSAPTAGTAAPAATPRTAPASAPAATTATKRIDVNGASEAELDALPGVGPALAGNIIKGRPWDDLADLVKKKAIPQGVYDRNKDRLALANINTSSAADMARNLPGVGDRTAPKIVAGRPYATPDELVSKKVLTQSQFGKVRDVITY